MSNCLRVLDAWVTTGRECVLVTVACTAGSAPREAGTQMVVTGDDTCGSIGGGNLEYQALLTARAFIHDTRADGCTSFLQLYALGSMLEQCCGGVVFLHYELIGKHSCEWIKLLLELESKSVNAMIISRTAARNSGKNIAGKLLVTEFETYGSLGELDEYALARSREFLHEPGTAPRTLLHSLTESSGRLPDISDTLVFECIRSCDFHIALFGAGHVGRAIVSVLANISACRVTWVDSREAVFPRELPPQVKAHQVAMPTNIVEDLPPAAYCLVMTHSHRLDQALCEAILKRNDYQYLGLIGSATKRNRFCKKLHERGISAKQLQGITCPIGIPGIESKAPGDIAVAVVAQLLQLYETRRNEQTDLPTDSNVYSI